MKQPVYHRMFDYRRSLLPNQHLASLEEGVVSIEEAQRKTGATIGYPGWGLIYHVLLSHLKRDRYEIIVETGTNWGCTTIALAQALEDAGVDGKVITIELEADNVQVATDNVRAAGLADRVEFLQGDSKALLEDTLRQYDDIRFAYLDASHLFNDVMFEFRTLASHLTEDAVVVFDNTYCIAQDGEDPRVNGALKVIKEEYGGNLINLESVSWFTPGLALWQKEPAL